MFLHPAPAALNPAVIHSRNHGYSHYTKFLAPGCLLGQTHLEPQQCLRLSCGDLTEFYYTLEVPKLSTARGSSSGVPAGRRLLRKPDEAGATERQ